MMSTATLPSLHTANLARQAADDERGLALARLRTGASDVAGIVRDACLPQGKALRRIPLVRVLSGRDGCSKRQARAILRQMLNLLGDRTSDQDVDRLTIMWLIDARAGGRRFRAFADALDPKEQAPWAGFPYRVPSSRPAHAGSNSPDRNGGNI